MRKSKKIFWLFLAPCLITFCIAVVVPTITGIYYSFTDWDGLHSNCDFVFLDNYISAFHDIYFQNAFVFTFCRKTEWREDIWNSLRQSDLIGIPVRMVIPSLLWKKWRMHRKRGLTGRRCWTNIFQRRTIPKCWILDADRFFLQ